MNLNWKKKKINRRKEREGMKVKNRKRKDKH